VVFEWDEAKNKINRRKHGLGFEEACHVFDDPLALSVPDARSHEEQRWRTIGQTAGLLVVLVAHTIRGSDDAEVIRIISAEGQPPMKGSAMKKKLSRRPELTAAGRRRLAALAARPEDEVDTSDIPELTASDFDHALRLAEVYRPRKKQITARIDVDVLLWLRSKGDRGYQSRLNAVLREAMAREAQQGKRATSSGRTSRKSPLARSDA
jgi:uncharacterized DUF497 family protein/uncharacterized protein (DUF4415 family)